MINPVQRLTNALKNNQGLFNCTLVLSFFIYGIIGVLKHEMWADEMQAWLIAQKSFSILNLLFNLRFEGHPPLWHILLYFISRFTSQPIYMQIVHVFIATVTIWVFVRFSPFSRVQKISFVFGYFPAYEYLVKSRSYVLGILFIFIFCSLFAKQARKYTLLFVILFLMAESNFIASIIALILGCFLLLEIFPLSYPAGLILRIRWKYRKLILKRRLSQASLTLSSRMTHCIICR